MPNSLAFAALILWPLVTLVLFLRLPPGRALMAAVLAGYLLLPPGPAVLDLPLVPDLGKEEIAALSAFLVAMVVLRPGATILPPEPFVRALLVLYVLAPLGSALTNPEPLAYGPVILPGLGLREALRGAIGHAIMIMPFLLARRYLTTPGDRRDLILAFVIGGLAYSLPALAEVRLSPQINTWVYGFFQHSFAQMMRGGGFRPLVFLYHALWLAFFLMTALVSAAALVRGTGGRQRTIAIAALFWLALTLLLGKSYAAIFYALLLVPTVLLLRPRLYLHLAAILAVIALAWPVARALDIVPTDTIVAMAGTLGPDRAHTLDFRFDNETALTRRALEKPVFGWGQWGRNQIFAPTTGRMLSITDGRWVITLGMFGFAGFLAEFGLLALPLLVAWRRRDRIAAGDGAIWTSTLALILGVNMFDLIPNATITPLTWLVCGAVLAALQEQEGTVERNAGEQAPGTAPPIATVL